MLDKQFADEFRQDWIAAWNRHDLERIVAHYSDDIEMGAVPFGDSLTAN
jgi:ketosteroid isomerase-like protein